SHRLFLYIQRLGHIRALHSFPTRRSSDLSPFPPSGLALRVEADRRGLEQRVSMRRQLCLFITPLIGVVAACTGPIEPPDGLLDRSEEHTSELQSRENLVCRLLLEKKKNKK